MDYKIAVNGYLKSFLQTQLNGLTGHIEMAGYPFDRVEWGKPDIIRQDGRPSWWVYEQTGYWLDGFTRCAILINDQAAIERARAIIYNVLNGVDEDGYIGPKFLKEEKERPSRWAHVVFFRSCMALYEYTKDTDILVAMEKHFLSDKAAYIDGRSVLNVEIILWLFEKTQNEKLLKMAEAIYVAYNEGCYGDVCDKMLLDNKKPYAHGVSYNEYSKLGAILYTYTKKQKYLDVSVKAYKKIDRYFMLPDGLHSCDEHLRSKDITCGHETCNVSDYTWSLNYLFEATQDSEYLDKIEKCIFNAGLGSVTKDFKALQYYSCVNQLVLTKQSNHLPYHRGEKSLAYTPMSQTECCTGNVNRFMPNYVMNMWKGEGAHVWLKMYGPSTYSVDGIQIVEETEYPFENTVRLSCTCDKPFFLHLRIPKWAESYHISEKLNVKQEDNGFIVVEIEGSCEFSISFSCKVEKHKVGNGIWFSKGCLVYAFAPEYKQETDGYIISSEYPNYNICVNGQWAYGVGESCTVKEEKDGTLSLEAYKIANWKLCRKKRIKVKTDGERGFIELYRTGDFLFTPSLPKRPVKADEEKTNIQLVPYGQTLCRITVFPCV